MTYSNTCNRRGHLAFASITAIAVSMSAVAVPSVPSQLPVKHHLVQLQAATVSAIQNTAAFAIGVANTTTTSSWVSDSAATAATATSDPEAITKSSTAELIAAGHSVPNAAATTEDSFWDSPLGTALIAVNVLLLPFWFLAAPITLPLSMFAAVSQIPEDDPIATLKFLVLTVVGFLTGPIGVFDIFTRQNPTPAAAVEPSAPRSLSPVEDHHPQENASEISPAADGDAATEQTAAEGTPNRGAAMARSAEPQPRRATTAKPAASASSDEGVKSSTADEANDTTKTRSSAERANRSSVEKTGRQERAIGNTE